jgi:predicted O-methyltransferase YrrM
MMEAQTIKDKKIKRFMAKKLSRDFLCLTAAAYLYTLAKKAGGEKSLCLEIGSGIGCSGVIIGSAIKRTNGKLISIDTFSKYPFHKSLSKSLWNDKSWGFETVINNFKQFEIDATLIVGDSTEMIPLFKDDIFDLIWIDGDHRYEGVKKDILNSIPKLKDGGILCGHDLRPRPDGPTNGVRTAVTEIFGNTGFEEIGGRIWRAN